MSDDDKEMDLETIDICDEAGRSLTCYVEQSIEVDGENFLLLLPVNVPIQIFAWEEDWDDDEEFGDDEDEDDVVLELVEDDEEIDDIFDTARAVLAEHNLILNRSAFMLTATGEVPEAEEEAIFSLDLGEDGQEDDPEQFQMLASFFYEEQQYTVCTPLDPLLFFAKRNAEGKPELIDPAEFQMIRPYLEDHLCDELD
jgi:hypothetical protein